MKNSIIFLNIDGVLISEDYILKNSGNVEELYTKINNNYYINFELSKIELLKELVSKTDSFIVIVSYWCENSDLNTIKSLFKKYGLDNKIIDIIPFTTQKSGYRVNNWINKKSSDFSNIDSTNFVIIDNDDTGILEDNHIKCNSKEGLTKDNVSNSIKVLNKIKK